MEKKYGFWKFIGDAILTVLTGGLYLIYLIFKKLH